MLEQYAKEKSQAKRYHCVKTFPDISEWQPKHSYGFSELQREMCCGHSCTGIRVKFVKYRDSHNSSVTLSSAESDHENSYRRCSYVAARNETPIKVGRIVALFQHSFLSVVTTFAYVSWFTDIHKDPDSKLLYALTSAQSQSVVPIKALSSPLVVAYDDEETEKLWILNY